MQGEYRLFITKLQLYPILLKGPSPVHSPFMYFQHQIRTPREAESYQACRQPLSYTVRFSFSSKKGRNVAIFTLLRLWINMNNMNHYKSMTRRRSWTEAFWSFDGYPSNKDAKIHTYHHGMCIGICVITALSMVHIASPFWSTHRYHKQAKQLFNSLMG